MRNSEKKGLLLLILVAALIIVAMIIFTKPTQKEEQNTNSTTQPSQTEIRQGEYTKVEQDGTVVNTSEKLKEDKMEAGFEISNISYSEKNGHTVLVADVTNMTGKDQAGFMADIVLLDKEGKEQGRIPVSITETKSGETIGIQAGITARYANAYDFKLEKK